jgi:signal transduction histidine kinase
VTIRVTAHDVRAEVSDDGIGPPGADATRGNGLGNLAARAAQAGGEFKLLARDGGGTTVDWRVPRSS